MLDQYQVNVTLSINEEKVKRNIHTNLTQIPTWFGDLFYPNGYKAIIVSAGPSMEKYVEQLNLKERMEDPKRDFLVFCVKHSLPRLLAMGIEPDFCVILDGRPFEEDSTHGKNRKELFKEIPERTIFMVASMSHPGYANYLLVNGARVLGWHTQVSGIDEFRKNGMIKEAIISGGTSSGTRCIGIANAMGIRDFTLVSFDSCIHNPTEEQLAEKDKKGRIKYKPVDLPLKNPKDQVKGSVAGKLDEVAEDLEKDGLVLQAGVAKRFYTTGELLAQAHDFEKIFSHTMFDFKIKVLDDGIVSHLFHNMANRHTRGHDFITHLSDLCPKKNSSKFPKREVALGKPKRKPNPYLTDMGKIAKLNNPFE